METQGNANVNQVGMMMVQMNYAKNATKLGIYLFIYLTTFIVLLKLVTIRVVMLLILQIIA